MRVSERRVPMAGWALLLWAGVSVWSACGGPKDQRDTMNVAAPAKYQAESDVRTALLAETTNYSFSENHKATPVDTTLAGGSTSLPTVTVATATRLDTTGRPHANRFIQRLHSDTAYARLGLAPGDNYIWRDSTSMSAGGTWRILVVPRNSSYPMVWWSADSLTARPLIDAGGAALLRRACNGFIACDGGCSPHCGATDIRAHFDFSRDASSIKIRN